MLRTIQMAVACVAVLIATAGQVQGAVISADLAMLGDGLLTRDTVQGLDFLDVTESLNRSFIDVSNQFGAGGDFEGFRYASVIEVINLVNNYGFTPSAVAGGSSIGGSVTHDDLDGLVDLLGQTSRPSSINRNVIAMVSDQNFLEQRVVILFDDTRPPTSVGFDYVSSFVDESVSGSNPSFDVASYLVRQTPTAIPEPGTIIVFASVLGIGLIARRRKQHLSNR